LTLPRSLRLAVWGNAWSRGSVSLDDAITHIVDADAAHDVDQGEGGLEPLIVSLGRLWRSGPALATCPVPGDLLALAGPPSFNADAVDAGEAVLIGPHGVLPHATGGGVVWSVREINPTRLHLSFREAAFDFRRALQETARTLDMLDLEAASQDTLAAVFAVDERADVALPVDLEQALSATTVAALRCLRLTEAAREDHSIDLSTSAASLRRDTLAPLDHAARRVLVAVSAAQPKR
jgi:hypothetical protein